MHRIDSAEAVEVRPDIRAVGTPGYFSEGNPALSQQATKVTQEWLNSVQEEIMAVIEEAGLAGDKEDDTLLLQALQAINFNPTLQVLTANGNVNAASRIVIIDCTLGNVTATLPAVSASGQVEKLFIRIDNTGNTATISRGGSDTIMGVNSVTIDFQYAKLKLFPYSAVWIDVG